MVRFVAVAALAAATAGCNWHAAFFHGTPSGELPAGPPDDVHLSADGRYLVYSVGQFTSTIVRRDLHTGDVEVLADYSFFTLITDISADARYVLLEANGSIVPGDGLFRDVFVLDTETGTAELVSIDAEGGPPDGGSSSSSLSPDGRYVVFLSEATDLTETPPTAPTAIYRRDLVAGETELLIDNDGISPIDLSEDGELVLIEEFGDALDPNDTNEETDVFVYDTATGAADLVSVTANGTSGDGASFGRALTPDGRYVLFDSDASDIGAGVADTNVYVRDRVLGETVLVSVDEFGDQSPEYAGSLSISDDGTRALFFMHTSHWPDTFTRAELYVHDLTTATSIFVAPEWAGLRNGHETFNGTMSADGRFVAFQQAHHFTDDDESELPLVVHAVDAPTAAGTAPVVLAPGATETLTIEGTDFVDGISVDTARVDGPHPLSNDGITVTVDVVSDTELTVELTAAPDAAPGARTVLVAVPGPGLDFAAAAVTCDCDITVASP